MRRRLAQWAGSLAIGVGLLMMGTPAWVLAGPAGRGALDGKVFIGRIGATGEQKGDEDEFQFTEGQFRSKACDPYGFESGAYTSEANGNVITFHAQTLSPTDGKMTWTGNVQGDTLEGTALWYRDRTPKAHWFKGTLKR